jgi:hypothetical protein
MPEGEVSITIADAAGKTLRTFSGTKVRGINRVYWDLRFDPNSPTDAALRPSAPNAPVPPAGSEEGPLQGPVPVVVPGARTSGPPPRVNILAPPGSFRVKLEVGGHEYSQSLTVLKDPSSGGSLREIELQTAMLQDLAGDLKLSVALTERVQTVRRQLKALIDELKDAPDASGLLSAAVSLELKFSAVEDKLRQQKPVAFYEWPVQLTAKFVYLAGHVQGSDREPTTQARAAHAFLKGELHAVKDEYDGLVAKDLAGFNQLLQKRGLKKIADEK